MLGAARAAGRRLSAGPPPAGPLLPQDAAGRDAASRTLERGGRSGAARPSSSGPGVAQAGAGAGGSGSVRPGLLGRLMRPGEGGAHSRAHGSSARPSRLPPLFPAPEKAARGVRGRRPPLPLTLAQPLPRGTPEPHNHEAAAGGPPPPPAAARKHSRGAPLSSQSWEPQGREPSGQASWPHRSLSSSGSPVWVLTHLTRRRCTPPPQGAEHCGGGERAVGGHLEPSPPPPAHASPEPTWRAAAGGALGPGRTRHARGRQERRQTASQGGSFLQGQALSTGV